MLYQLPLARVMQLFKDITEYRHDEQQERYKEQAFNAWITYRTKTQKGMDFSSFLNTLGLGDKRQVVTAEEAYKTADSILAAMAEEVKKNARTV
ncbi:hypothetical protein BTO30_13465 [Domibacillus antri]|uniref:Uncharacterized protein n=1 Tax=Domibacillus antri TaxID=1714264 RepID=A0A1Q8Q2Y9_9BACI|nr:hypothetical protein [Domibacillus antri]OLN21706.1 hypothetical protein BTO30_13465 [Domibacillus antri]